MKILDVLHREAVLTDLKAVDKKGVLNELTIPVAQNTGILHQTLINVLQERENLGSTGIGGGIGIPHGKLESIIEPILGFGLSRKGVRFESLDGRPTHLFFVLFTPENSTGLHLKLLARISRLLKNDTLKERLMNSNNCEEIINILKENDEDF